MADSQPFFIRISLLLSGVFFNVIFINLDVSGDRVWWPRSKVQAEEP